MTRDLDKNPYSADEKRVAEFLFERDAGGGDDPIGFILASYAYLINERNEMRDALRKIAYAPKGSVGPTLSESIQIARKALGEHE